jgi:AcrR family transcriptional regulator
VTSGRYHHGNLRMALLEQAERLLDKVGAHELSLREVARAAGVSHSALRHHFADKQALLDALAETGFERLGRELDEALAATDGPFADRLIAFAKTYVGFAVGHPNLVTLMHASKESSPRLRAANDRAFAAPSELIAQAQARGDIVDGDSDRVAMAVLATLQGLVALVVSGMSGDRPVDGLVSGTIETLLHGLRPRTTDHA